MLGGISLWLTHNLIDIDGRKKLHKPKKKKRKKTSNKHNREKFCTDQIILSRRKKAKKTEIDWDDCFIVMLTVRYMQYSIVDIIK